MPELKDKPAILPDIGKEKATADILAFNEDFSKNAGSIIAQGAQNPYAELSPYAFDPKSTSDLNKNYERYYSHPQFKQLGFNPWSDNESLYNEKGSASGDVWRAVNAGMKLANTGFKSPIRSYADIFAGDILRGDDASAKEMKYYNTVGSSSRGGVGGFISNLAVNSGFSVGFIGEAIAEQAALTALTAFTRGGTAELQAVRAAKTAKDFGQYAQVIEGLSDATKAISEYPAAKTAWEGFKKAGKFLNPISNTTSALDASKNLTGLARISQTAAGFFRDVSAANFTLAEAKVEGATTTMDTEEDLVREFKKKNEGRTPSFDELLQIKEAAKTAGDKTLAFNIPAIYLTNKLTFAPLFNSFTKSSEYILRNGVRFIEKEGEGLVEATFLNRTRAALKPKNLWKFPLTYLAGNISEGVQEVTQDIVSGASKEYYTNLYNTSVNKGLTFAQAENQNYGGGGWDAISHNAKNQFSGRGFETFASGFFMGGLLKVAALPITAARLGFSEYRKTKNEYTQRALEAGNAIYNDPLKWFAPQALNYSSTADGVANQTEAENEDNQKMWGDFEDQNTWSHLTTALDTGTYDILVDKLRKIKSMTPEAITEAYGQDGQAVLSKIDKIIARAENLKTNYAKWNERASNPFNPKAFQKDTPEYNKEALSFIAWEAAKKSAIFQDYSFGRNTQRISSISQDLLQTPEFKNLNPNDVSLLFDPRGLRNELGLLNNEIEVLSNSEIPGDRSTLRQKETKRDRLVDFQNRLQNYYVTQRLESMSEEDKKAHPEIVERLKSPEFKKTTQDQLRSAYEKYIKHLGTSQANVVQVGNLNLESSFKQLLDIHELKQENLHLTQAINLLANPKGFTDHYKALFDTFSNLYNNREDIIRKSIEDTQKKIELNVGLLKPLYDRGFVVDSKNLEALIDRGEVPSEFYDLNAKQVVNDQDPFRYQQFQEIVGNYQEATKPEETITETTPKGVVITNLNEIIAAGSGRLQVEKDGKPIEFNMFDIAIDREANTAEVTNVEKKDITKDKGVGFQAYVELGQQLLDNGITLVSPASNVKKQLGIDLWNRLVKAGYATGSSNKGYTFTGQIAKAETAQQETQVVEDARELHVDIAKKFDDVHTGEQLEALTQELTALMADTTLEERLKAGLNSKNIDAKIHEKEQELLTNITLDNLSVGNIVSMVDPDYGNMKVIRKTAKDITLQKIGDGNLKITIEKDKLKENIKSKYSEKMGKETTQATPEEKSRVAENVIKQEKFTDNRELLEEVMDDAFKNEEKYQKEFLETLGCK